MLALPLLLMLTAGDAHSKTVPLWEGKAPHAIGATDTDRPTLTSYPAPPDIANGTAVVICPGGGYGGLAMDHEGRQVAQYFNKLGVTAFVLKYRTANKERPGPLHPAPLTDAQRAIRYVRSVAKEYDIDPARVGLIGFSAGGHLASTAGTHFDAGLKNGDAIDRQSSRPDFLVLAYPVITMEAGVTHAGSRRNLLGEKPDAKLIENLSNEKQVTKDTPPTFIFQTSADTAVIPENAMRFYLACKKASVPVELHLYEKGRHGVGLGSDPRWTGGETSVASWPNRLTDWLKSRGFLEKK